jgi:hypothetical protein
MSTTKRLSSRKVKAKDSFDYRIKYVEIRIEGDDLVEFDHKTNKEISRRPATEVEKLVYSDED